jgi:hypothetical protein
LYGGVKVNQTGIAAAVTKTKVYYVLKYHGHNYVAGMGSGSSTDLYCPVYSPLAAKQFTSVLEAALFATKHANAKGVGTLIVRVEETPGTRTLRLVSTRVIDAAKPVVIYSPKHETYLKQYDTALYGGSLMGAQSISDATVFSDLDTALSALQANANDQPKNLPKFTSAQTHIHQVEYVTTEPTVTETVLS